MPALPFLTVGLLLPKVCPRVCVFSATGEKLRTCGPPGREGSVGGPFFFALAFISDASIHHSRRSQPRLIAVPRVKQQNNNGVLGPVARRIEDFGWSTGFSRFFRLKLGLQPEDSV